MRSRLARTARVTVALGFTALFFPVAFGTSEAAASETCPNKTVREQQESTYLPDCRGFELVTPANKDDEEATPPTYSAQFEAQYQMAAGKPETSFSLTGGFPGSEGAVEFAFGLSKGGEPGHSWSQSAFPLTNSIESVESPAQVRAVGAPLRFSPELTCGYESSDLAQPAHPGETTPLLPPGEEPGEEVANLYLWRAATNGLELATNIMPRDPQAAIKSSEWAIDGMSENCEHVAFSINGAEGQELPLNAERTEFAAQESIYEWSPGTKEKLASIVPANEGHEEVPAHPISTPQGGFYQSDLNAMSTNGEEFYFTAPSEEPGVEAEVEGKKISEAGTRSIFDRFRGEKSFDISRSQTSVPDSGAVYEAASANGERVFFLANYGLASNGASNGSTKGCIQKEVVEVAKIGCDLYEYRASSEHPGEGTLTDLSVDSQAGGADVTALAGVANSGEYVYFDALGQLVEGEGPTRSANEAAHTESLYAYHAGHLSYIATIAEEEAAFLGQSAKFQERVLDAIEDQDSKGLRYLASRVSPDGKRLLFATNVKQKVVGMPEPEYNNLDTKSGMPDPEMYEYQYTEGAPAVVCVSCKPDGGRPTVGLGGETQPYTAEGGYVPTYNGVPSTVLLNDGRVFFDSFTPLLEGTTLGAHAYEFQPSGYTDKYGDPACEQEKGCVTLLEPGKITNYPSWVEGASENGENVYVLTYERLARAQDDDGLRDLYDVREGGGQLAQSPVEKCNLNKDECQGEGTKKIGETGIETGVGKEPPGTVTHEPPPTPLPPVKATHKSSTSHGVTVTFKASGPGLVRLSGAGLKTAARIVSHAGTFTLKTSYNRATMAALRKHHHPRIKATLLFRPLADTGSDSSVSWSLKA